MKYPISLKSLRYGAFALLLGCVAIGVAGAWRSSAYKENEKTAMKLKFHARVRDGVGREVKLARKGDRAGRVQAAVNSVADFIAKRSGAQLSGATRNRLAAAEERAQNGAGRLTVSKVSDAINATMFERLSSLSDRDIAQVDETLRGFNAPQMPKKYARDLKLPGGLVFMGTPPEKTVGRLKAVRDQIGTPAGEVFEGMTRKFVGERVKSRAQYLSEAIPEQFGNVWDVTNDKENDTEDGGVTPLQAVLITYSLASDDYLADSEDSLNKDMSKHQENLTKLCGQPYPAPGGHHAYGVNGYLFSSPLDLVFDDQTLNRLLDRLEGRSAS
jgi:hypothetical protein